MALLLSCGLAACGSNGNAGDGGRDAGPGPRDSEPMDTYESADGAPGDAVADSGVVALVEGDVAAADCRGSCQTAGASCTDSYDWFPGLGQFGGAELTYGLCKIYQSCGDPVEPVLQGCGPLTGVRCACLE